MSLSGENAMVPRTILNYLDSPNSLYLDEDLFILDGATGIVERCNVFYVEGNLHLLLTG